MVVSHISPYLNLDGNNPSQMYFDLHLSTDTCGSPARDFITPVHESRTQSDRWNMGNEND